MCLWGELIEEGLREEWKKRGKLGFFFFFLVVQVSSDSGLSWDDGGGEVEKQMDLGA